MKRNPHWWMLFIVPKLIMASRFTSRFHSSQKAPVRPYSVLRVRKLGDPDANADLCSGHQNQWPTTSAARPLLLKLRWSVLEHASRMTILLA
jgi:hypothetical protein